jgi:TetR/AcrR family transcriptional regulator, regulator of mycofactocin system
MSTQLSSPTPVRGRPRSTTRAEVARTALELFARRGFEETTMEDIAAELGISRRTLFRYFASKNDMVWGDFDWVLERLREELDRAPADGPVMEAMGRAVVASNHYEPEDLPELRIRMTLITTVPALQAHSMLRYAAWRRVIAEFVAQRLDQKPDDLIPETIGHAALGTSMAAFVRWVKHPGDDLEHNLSRGYRLLASGLEVAVDDAPVSTAKMRRSR